MTTKGAAELEQGMSLVTSVDKGNHIWLHPFVNNDLVLQCR